MASADSCLSPAGFFALLPTGAASCRSQAPEDTPLVSSWTLRPDCRRRPCRTADRSPRIRTCSFPLTRPIYLSRFRQTASIPSAISPSEHGLISGFCSSGQRFGTSFLPTPPRDDAVALAYRFSCMYIDIQGDDAEGDLHPMRTCPCRAYTRHLNA